MVNRSVFLFSVTALLWWPTAIVVAKEENDDKPLFFQQLDYFAPCSDGSPAGIYTDFGTSNEALSDEETGTGTGNSHVIHFNGGGGCSSAATCLVLSKQKPYYFSSLYEFESITGHTIASNDPFENPGLADFAKWVVPYCTQDLWLGSGEESFGFLRSGSLQVDATLKHWLDAVSNTTVDTLVFSGHSAGTFAILNHIDQIRNVAREAGVKRLRFVLDASLLTDNASADFDTLFEKSVDPEVHPLCLEDPEKTPYDELRNRAEISQLPCCLSTHCMLRHSPSLRDITSGNLLMDERLLLIDTVYDFLQTFSYLASEKGNRNAVGSGGMMSVTGLSSSVFNIGEAGGKRKARIMETLFAGERYVGPNVVWAMPSATLHNTIVPSVEISTRVCDRYGEKDAAAGECTDSDCVFIANPFGIQDVCNATGIGLSVEVFGGLKMTSWTNTEAWKRTTINGMSIRDIISEFVLTPGPASGSNYTSALFEQEHATVLFDTCPGPNCVPEGQKSGNPVQSMVEIEDTFVSVPVWLQVLVSLVLFTIVVAYLFMAYYVYPNNDNDDDNDKNDNDDGQQKPTLDTVKSKRLLRVNTTRAMGSDIHLRGLDVTSDKGSKILEDVDLSLEHSTLNCLLGKSGSGKSTLLSTLSCQLKSNLNVSLKAATDISSIPSTFLRQLDLVTMENITPISYLTSTSKIYGADSENLEFVLSLIRPFFPIKTMKDENDVEIILLDPFNTAAIRDLSGGQRRLLAIASALFQNTTLLLLDEPLSGLDSVSSMKVIALLNFIAKENAVTIFMTLHQPSNEILEAMDGIMVLNKGKVAFDSRIDTIQGDKRSSADFIHDLLSDEVVAEIEEDTLDLGAINEEEEEEVDVNNFQLSLASLGNFQSMAKLGNFESSKTSLRILESSISSLGNMQYSRSSLIQLKKTTKVRSAKHFSETMAPTTRKLQRMKSVKNEKKLDSFTNELRLWQVQPLVRRMALEHPLKPQDILALPICFLVLSGWGSIDSQSPFLSFLLTISNISAAVVINQVRVVVNWDVLAAHLWDLEDKRVSPLSFLIASGFQMMHAPIIAIPLSNALSYAILGWSWEPYWVTTLFMMLTCIVGLQLGKTISAYMSSFRPVAALYNVLIFIGFVMSGAFISPDKVPPGAQWIMFLSPFFWGSAGSLLSMFEHAELGEQPCQSFASCIVYNPNFMAFVTGYPSLVSARTSMWVLIAMAIILVLIEYILLCQKVVQRNDYTKQASDKDGSVEEEEEVIKFEYESSSRSSCSYVVERRRET